MPKVISDTEGTMGTTNTAPGVLHRAGSAAGLGDPDLLGPRMRRRRAVILILMTALIPGSAQLIAGNRRVGRLGVGLWALTLLSTLTLGVLYLIRRSTVLGLFSRSWFMLLIAVLLILGALLWLVFFIDAVRLAQLRATPVKTRALVSGLTALLLVGTCGSMVFAASNVLAGRSAVMSLFGTNIAKEPTNGRYNVLLLGGDSGADRIGTRPDTIMLASVDADTGKAVMFGFARDTENINFRPGSVMHNLMPEGWNCGDKCLLNGLYTWAMEHKDHFPADVKDPGALATKEAVEALSGLSVHYYVLVDLRGFQRLVDAVGGLEMNVKKRTPIGGGTSRISGWIEPGIQHLDGYHALWYARSRQGSSNDERMARQRCVLTAMSQQLNPQTVILRFKDIADISGSVLQTDLPESDLGGFADLALKSRQYRIKSVNFVQPLIQPWSYDPAVITRTVRDTIEASQRDDTTVTPRPATPKPTSSPSRSSKPTRSTVTSKTTPTPDAPAAEDLSSVCAPA